MRTEIGKILRELLARERSSSMVQTHLRFYDFYLFPDS